MRSYSVCSTAYWPEKSQSTGDPLAILISDPEDGPKSDATCELTVVTPETATRAGGLVHPHEITLADG
jgi:hypothetical protein